MAAHLGKAQNLQVYLLGLPKVLWGGQPLALPRRQVRALLYRLAVRLAPVSREELSFLFWPDMPDAKARRNLSFLMSHLRRALPAPDVILVAEDYIQLDSAQVWSDTVAFQGLCAIPSSEDALQQAVDLYRGPLIAGMSLPGSPEFEAWLQMEQQIWERSYLEALGILIADYSQHGQLNAAIAAARRYLVTDDLAEAVHRELIQLYATAGDRASAMAQYERCVVVLERELGVRPLPETYAAYQEAIRGCSQPPSRPAPPTTWTTLPSLAVPLVGREEALSVLSRAFICSQSGHGSAVLIAGEPGIGKSRLMQDFATGVMSKATLLIGSAYETERGLPYWPLIEAVRPHIAHVNWDELEVPPSSWRS